MIDTPFEPDLYLLQVYLEQSVNLSERPTASLVAPYVITACLSARDQCFTMVIYTHLF